MTTTATARLSAATGTARPAASRACRGAAGRGGAPPRSRPPVGPHDEGDAGDREEEKSRQHGGGTDPDAVQQQPRVLEVLDVGGVQRLTAHQHLLVVREGDDAAHRDSEDGREPQPADDRVDEHHHRPDHHHLERQHVHLPGGHPFERRDPGVGLDMDQLEDHRDDDSDRQSQRRGRHGPLERVRHAPETRPEPGTPAGGCLVDRVRLDVDPGGAGRLEHENRSSEDGTGGTRRCPARGQTLYERLVNSPLQAGRLGVEPRWRPLS